MHFVFYCKDGASAKARATELKGAGNKARATDCLVCRECDPEVTSLEFMPDVPQHERERVTKLFGRLPLPPGAALPKPPAENPLAPLEKLPIGWREKSKTADLVKIANAVTGRMPEDRAQAIALIAQKLAGE